jgi:hypothetical protein
MLLICFVCGRKARVKQEFVVPEGGTMQPCV